MPVILPYCAEYAITEQLCNKCGQPIETVQIAIMQLCMSSDSMEPQWYDMDCFFQVRRPISVNLIDGFANLRYKHQMEIYRKLGIDFDANSTTAEQKALNESSGINYALEKEIEQQANDFFEIYDKLKHFKGANFVNTLRAMNQYVPERYVDVLNHLTDIICFGALSPCSVCNDGKMVLQGSLYRCTGYDSPWSSCINSVKEPQRIPPKLPQEYQELFENSLKVRTRILRDAIDFNIDELELHTKQPLFNMTFFIYGETKIPRKDIEYKIQAMGGKMASRIHSSLVAVISNENEVKNKSILMQNVFVERVQVIPDDFLDEVMENDPIKVIVTKNLSKWAKNPYDRIPELKTNHPQMHNTNDRPRSFFDSTVIPNRNEENVFCSNDVRYEVLLDFVDISSNKNTYFKMQILQLGTVYALFETTGRIGASSSNIRKSRACSTMHHPQAEFKRIYQEKTGNVFDAEVFVKKPGLFNHVNTANESLANVSRYMQTNAPESKLSKPLYELMDLLYNDDNVFKSTLVAFCIDANSMPLGRLNKFQIQVALNYLSDILTLLTTANVNEIVAASNQFYSIFPQIFGQRRPSVINTPEMVQEKIKLLQYLLEKELKYEFLISDLNKEKNLLDLCYEQLQESAEITMLNKSSGMYAQICDYVKNTQLNEKQPDLFTNYYDVDEIFEVARHEEILRYAPYEENFNRQLLFHGTPVQNYVNILTNGLKISPPEAHFTGSIFGKGIYFSDSVSKSIYYCRTYNSSFSLMLLCEVAAGRTDVRYVQNSKPLIDHCECVQALGQYYPHPLYIRPDGLKIPNGKLIKRTERTGIQFNEFVVADEARVKIRYLIKVKFTPEYYERSMYGPSTSRVLPPMSTTSLRFNVGNSKP